MARDFSESLSSLVRGQTGDYDVALWMADAARSAHDLKRELRPAPSNATQRRRIAISKSSARLQALAAAALLLTLFSCLR